MVLVIINIKFKLINFELFNTINKIFTKYNTKNKNNHNKNLFIMNIFLIKLNCGYNGQIQ